MYNTTDISRRPLLAAALLLPFAGSVLAAPQQHRIEVWKDPNCGCCQDWIQHLEQNGFSTKVHDSGNTARRAQLGIAAQYASCHTAVVGGYALEGHVPARDIHRLLKERPQGIGLAVPGMPIGSPGMDGPEYGQRRDAYEVLLLKTGGGSAVFQAYDGKQV